MKCHRKVIIKLVWDIDDENITVKFGKDLSIPESYPAEKISWHWSNLKDYKGHGKVNIELANVELQKDPSISLKYDHTNKVSVTWFEWSQNGQHFTGLRYWCWKHQYKVLKGSEYPRESYRTDKVRWP